jgi:hypothetical protein
MLWAYTPAEYKLKPGASATSIWRPLWDSYVLPAHRGRCYIQKLTNSDLLSRINFCKSSKLIVLKYQADQPLYPPLPADFAMEIIISIRFFIEYTRGKPHTRSQSHHMLGEEHDKVGFGEAFGVSTSHVAVATSPSSPDLVGGSRTTARHGNVAARPSYEEHIHLASYSGYPPQDLPPHSVDSDKAMGRPI